MHGLNAGYGLLLAVLLGSGSGILLDAYWDWSPLGLLTGGAFGFVAGMYQIYLAMTRKENHGPQNR